MSQTNIESNSSRLVVFGTVFVTLFMISGGVTDPVNVPKFFALGTLGGGCAMLIFVNLRNRNWKEQRLLLIYSALFLISSLSALIFSNAPLTQNLYGSYGRNNGLIAYIALVFIMLLSASLNQRSSFSLLARGLLFSGVANVAYCSWVLSFGDFMGWDNPYKNLLGTFGNPNFIGSFLSIFSSAALAYIVAPTQKLWIRLSLSVLVIISIIEMIHTNVMQGKVVLALGFSLVLGVYIKTKFLNRNITLIYFSLLTGAGLFAILGMLQKGPLTKYIYQYTVSLRGQYWMAGFRTGVEHLFTGVGFDSFGDWYRRTRSAQALITPGVNVTVNTAHNVVIDLFAFGGLPLVLAYLLIICLTIKRMISTFVSLKKYDPVFVALSVAWIGYQAQSVISINQLGLAIWGWVLSGAIIGYTSIQSISSIPKEVRNGKKTSRHVENTLLSPGISAALGLVVGAIISVPPLASDMNFRSAEISRNPDKLQQALISTYMHPQNTNTYLNTAIMFEQAGLNDQAVAITHEALKFNPDSFETWRALYFMKKSSNNDKDQALRNMKRLDPLNKNLTEVPK
jgi:hypothetical protein